jgi:hypothetical protein
MKLFFQEIIYQYICDRFHHTAGDYYYANSFFRVWKRVPILLQLAKATISD